MKNLPISFDVSGINGNASAMLVQSAWVWQDRGPIINSKVSKNPPQVPATPASFFPGIFLLMFPAIFLATPSHAFNDDSFDETALWESIKGICDDGLEVKDSKNERFSCKEDKVRLDPQSGKLYKNKVLLNRNPVKDFKVSRNGKVFYRDRESNLYDERGKLKAEGGSVSLYLVSSNGDVVYLNQRGDLFKNGKKLSRKVKAIIKRSKAFRFVYGRRIRQAGIYTNPAVSRNGMAVYIDGPEFGTKPKGSLFVEGKRISPTKIEVTDFKLNDRGDVYYRDTKERLYLNRKQISKGRAVIGTYDDYKLNPQGQLAYLTESKVLIFQGKVQPAGNKPVINFHFNSEGDLFYRDSNDHRWKNGRKIRK